MPGLTALALLLCLAGQGGAQPLALDADLKPGATEGCAETVLPPAPRSTLAAGAVKILSPSAGFYTGAYQIPAQPQTVGDFAAKTGFMPPIVFSFHDMFADTNSGTAPDQQFLDPMEGEGSLPPLVLAEHLAARGSVLALAWASYCCDIGSLAFWLRLKRPHDHFNRILAGAHDDFFRDSARQIKAYGGPILLTVVPEMNWQGQFLFGADGRQWMDAVDNICTQYGDPSWPDGPERIRDVTMHIIDIFRAEGAHNVTWFMYSGNQYMAPGVEGQSQWLHPRYYYPGDAYIDWVGQSVYFTDAEGAAEYEDTGAFDAVFLPGYAAWQSVTARPLLLAEFGILAEPGRDRSALWREALLERLPALPGVKAITIADSLLFELYFNIPRLGDTPGDLTIVRQQIEAAGAAMRLRTTR